MLIMVGRPAGVVRGVHYGPRCHRILGDCVPRNCWRRRAGRAALQREVDGRGATQRECDACFWDGATIDDSRIFTQDF